MHDIGAVILAAGKGKRFGQTKQLIPLNDKPLFLYPVHLALQLNLNPIVLIGNEKTESMKDDLIGLNVTYIQNQDYQKGMATSLKKGVIALNHEPRAAFIFLADQPFVPTEVINKMIDVFDNQYSNGIRIVRPSYQGELGHPVLFDRCLFQNLTNIKGDKGAREIIKVHHEKVEIVEFSTKEWNMDIDKPEDYEKAKNYIRKIKKTEKN